MFKKFVLTVFVFFLLNTLYLVRDTTPVLASVRCETQYGGGQTCVRVGELLVNKKVYNPDSKTFVDNLGLSDHRFQLGDEVVFKIDIKNVGDATLDTVNFTDTLPSFLAWSGGDQLNLTISNLAAGQVVTKEIRAKVLVTKGVVCGLNTVVISSAQNGSDRDMAKLCVGQPPKVIPQAGPEMGILALLSGLGGIGYFLRKVKSVLD